MSAGRRCGLCRASSAGAGSREYTEVCCRRNAVCVRRILDGRRPWSGLAGRRSCDRCFCGTVPGRWKRGSRPGTTFARGGFAMNMLGAVFRELIGLFVDDGSLALEIVAVVILSPLFSTLVTEGSFAAGAGFSFCCLLEVSASTQFRHMRER